MNREKTGRLVVGSNLHHTIFITDDANLQVKESMFVFCSQDECFLLQFSSLICQIRMNQLNTTYTLLLYLNSLHTYFPSFYYCGKTKRTGAIAAQIIRMWHFKKFNVNQQIFRFYSHFFFLSQ